MSVELILGESRPLPGAAFAVPAVQRRRRRWLLVSGEYGEADAQQASSRWLRGQQEGQDTTPDPLA